MPSARSIPGGAATDNLTSINTFAPNTQGPSSLVVTRHLLQAGRRPNRQCGKHGNGDSPKIELVSGNNATVTGSTTTTTGGGDRRTLCLFLGSSHLVRG